MPLTPPSFKTGVAPDFYRKTAQEYTIDLAEIHSERLDKRYDVKSYVMELSLFEDINLPYLSGKIVCMDDMGSFDEMALKGTEQIDIIVNGAEENYRDLVGFALTMNITSIVKRTKTNERTEVYQLNLISPHAFRDQGIKLSKSFNGNLDVIATRVLQNQLGVMVDWAYRGDYVDLNPVKVLTPYMTPLEISKWLLHRATTAGGIPFYLWPSVYEQNEEESIRLGTLDMMITGSQYVWNDQRPLMFSQSRAASVALEKTYDQAFIIKAFETRDVEDTTQMMLDGAVGSNLTVLDTYTSQYYSRQFSGKDFLDKRGELLYRPKGLEQNVLDEDLTFTFSGQKKKSYEWNNRQFDQLTSYGTYHTDYSYHDEPDERVAMNKIRARAVRSMFDRNSVEMMIPGSAFFRPMAEMGVRVGVGAGDLTRVEVITSVTREEGLQNPNFSPAADSMELDQHRSGYYLCQRCRHTFAGSSHSVSATMTKIASGPLVVTGNPHR